MSSPATVTYLRTDDVDIQFDLYIPTGRELECALPVVVFFHGGGLVTGSRGGTHCPDWKDDLLKRNIIFISADYRLLFPCTSFDEIADVKALFSFLSNPELINVHLPANVTIDITRIAVSGSSAGGYMARLAALYANPRPRALWSLYGMGGDFFLDHWVQKHNEGFALAGGTTKRDEVAPFLDGRTPVTASAPLDTIGGKLDSPDNRLQLFNWLYQEGTYVDKVSGLPGLAEKLRVLPHGDRAAAVPKEISAVFPQLVLTAEFPPTLLTHGNEDSLVLLAESEETARQLTALGVKTNLTVVAGAEHGLGPARPGMETNREGAIREGVEFLASYLA